MMKFPSTHNIFVNDVFDSFENTIELKAKMSQGQTWSIESGLESAQPFFRYASRTSSQELQHSSSDCKRKYVQSSSRHQTSDAKK